MPVVIQVGGSPFRLPIRDTSMPDLHGHLQTIPRGPATDKKRRISPGGIRVPARDGPVASSDCGSWDCFGTAEKAGIMIVTVVLFLTLTYLYWHLFLKQNSRRADNLVEEVLLEETPHLESSPPRQIVIHISRGAPSTQRSISRSRRRSRATAGNDSGDTDPESQVIPCPQGAPPPPPPPPATFFGMGSYPQYFLPPPPPPPPYPPPHQLANLTLPGQQLPICVVPPCPPPPNIGRELTGLHQGGGPFNAAQAIPPGLRQSQAPGDNRTGGFAGPPAHPPSGTPRRSWFLRLLLGDGVSPGRCSTIADTPGGKSPVDLSPSACPSPRAEASTTGSGRRPASRAQSELDWLNGRRLRQEHENRRQKRKERRREERRREERIRGERIREESIQDKTPLTVSSSSRYATAGSSSSHKS